MDIYRTTLYDEKTKKNHIKKMLPLRNHIKYFPMKPIHVKKEQTTSKKISYMKMYNS